MINRAQVTQPYTVDMFITLPLGALVTFTDDNTPNGYYKVLPNGDNYDYLVQIDIFNHHFKYYIQTKLL